MPSATTRSTRSSSKPSRRNSGRGNYVRWDGQARKPIRFIYRSKAVLLRDLRELRVPSACLEAKEIASMPDRPTRGPAGGHARQPAVTGLCAEAGADRRAGAGARRRQGGVAARRRPPASIGSRPNMASNCVSLDSLPAIAGGVLPGPTGGRFGPDTRRSSAVCSRMEPSLRRCGKGNWYEVAGYCAGALTPG
jgi:hypothetical protein